VTSRPIGTVVVALTLAACGSGAAATTAADDATVAPYARLVDDHDREWRANVADIHRVCADSTAADRCAAAYLTASEQAAELRGALSAVRDRGEVPADTAALVADTQAVAADYSAAYQAWEATGCANPLNAHCGADEALAMFQAQGKLTRQLDAWKPHAQQANADKQRSARPRSDPSAAGT
jgi:hypothetical protein